MLSTPMLPEIYVMTFWAHGWAFPMMIFLVGADCRFSREISIATKKLWRKSATAMFNRFISVERGAFLVS